MLETIVIVALLVLLGVLALTVCLLISSAIFEESLTYWRIEGVISKVLLSTAGLAMITAVVCCIIGGIKSVIG